MKSYITLGLALASLLLPAGPASAAWDNVFQVTCWGCRQRSSNYYAVPSATAFYYQAPTVAFSSPCDPCPQPCQQCTTKYVQRCYYQPVTTYQTQTYYEPITTYQTRTYYEPVTTYRYSCYYDPCSCSYQQVATPCTSYVARQQACPVQSWVQRCAQVPVTSYQKAYYYEPQTTCCTTTVGAAVAAPCPTCPPATAPSQSYSAPAQTQPPPKAIEGGGTSTDPYKPLDQSINRQLSPNGKAPFQPAAPNGQSAPSVRIDRIVSNQGPAVQGQILGDSNAPKAGVQLIFVSAKRESPEQTVTSNGSGRFEVNLAAGEWLVYVRGPGGQQAFHSRMTVHESQSAPIVLVSR
jgi:hypothetical protein